MPRWILSRPYAENRKLFIDDNIVHAAFTTFNVHRSRRLLAFKFMITTISENPYLNQITLTITARIVAICLAGNSLNGAKSIRSGIRHVVIQLNVNNKSLGDGIELIDSRKDLRWKLQSLKILGPENSHWTFCRRIIMETMQLLDVIVQFFRLCDHRIVSMLYRDEDKRFVV